jgi:hypothetical protein
MKYRCPYQVDKACEYQDPEDIFAPEFCEDCELYDNGVRPTGCLKYTKITTVILFIVIVILIL